MLNSHKPLDICCVLKPYIVKALCINRGNRRKVLKKVIKEMEYCSCFSCMAQGKHLVPETIRFVYSSEFRF